MRIDKLLLLSLVSCIRGCGSWERGTFKKFGREMVLLLRILEDIMRSWTLENSTWLLSLVVISSKTRRYWGSRLSQRINSAERKWMVERNPRCSCTKITCMLEVVHCKTSTQEIILIILILMIECIIYIRRALLMRAVMHSISTYWRYMQRWSGYSSTISWLFHHYLMMMLIHELSFSHYLARATATIFGHLLHNSLFVWLLLLLLLLLMQWGNCCI